MNPLPYHLRPLRTRGVLTCAAGAGAAFILSYATDWLAWMSVVYLFALLNLARADTWRKAFYPGLLAGLVVAAAHLDFFYRIFSLGAVALWLVYAVWIGLFALLARQTLHRFGPNWAAVLVPFAWMGLEYFRSELYYLRFSWCSPGMTFAFMPGMAPFAALGTYGLGFVLTLVAALACFVWGDRWWKSAGTAAFALVLLSFWGLLAGPDAAEARKKVRVAGVQMEFPTESEVLIRLNEVIRKTPETELVVVSEYTLQDPPTESIRDWCRKNNRYLVIGGKDPAGGQAFFNTAFVVSPAGEVVFRQAKSVPIQFFKDGLPARAQEVWNSPWGKLGMCICYDLSYTRVTDRLVRQGAEALIVPTMDVADWGGRQHQLHTRVAPVRAAEYQLPVFRLASSGISQAVARNGQVLATAPFPGEGAIISGTLELRGPGGLPVDRWLAPLSVAVTVVLAAWLVFSAWLAHRSRAVADLAAGEEPPPLPETTSPPCSP